MNNNRLSIPKSETQDTFMESSFKYTNHSFLDFQSKTSCMNLQEWLPRKGYLLDQEKVIKHWLNDQSSHLRNLIHLSLSKNIKYNSSKKKSILQKHLLSKPSLTSSSWMLSFYIQPTNDFPYEHQSIIVHGIGFLSLLINELSIKFRKK